MTAPADKLAVTNPANGETVGSVRTYTPDEVAAIIERADSARGEWAARTAAERSRILRAWMDLVLENKEDIARTMTAESGKPLRESRGEVDYGASYIGWFAEEGRRAYGETIPTFARGKRVLTIRQPVGTCTAITPWNFPLAMIARKAAPALAVGCAMVVKPAEATPLTALAIEELAHEAGIPRDVFRIVPTDDPSAIGKVLSTHPLVRKLSFTGSTAVGQILMRQAADNVLRLSLELGGNAPFIVFDDADLDAAVDGAIAAKFRNAGQTCVCANRIMVQDAIHDRFVAALTQKVAALEMGDGSDESTDIGPLIDEKARKKVAGLVQSAKDAGAKVETGANAGGNEGCFYPPTVLSGVTPDMDIASTEIFGPVATVLRFSTEDEAIRISNDTPFGLAAYFYSRDIGRIWRVMEGLEYGMVAVNEPILSTEIAPFGGIKHSGQGREGAQQGLDEYLEIKYCLMGGIEE